MKQTKTKEIADDTRTVILFLFYLAQRWSSALHKLIQVRKL